jgi:hypothetical protein
MFLSVSESCHISDKTVNIRSKNSCDIRFLSQMMKIRKDG